MASYMHINEHLFAKCNLSVNFNYKLHKPYINYSELFENFHPIFKKVARKFVT